MNSDFRDLLRTFNEAGVRYLVVGGYAYAEHVEPRYTKDLDLWIERSADKRPHSDCVTSFWRDALGTNYWRSDNRRNIFSDRAATQPHRHNHSARGNGFCRMLGTP